MAGRNAQSGVYRIRSMASGAVYVGSSKNLVRRRWEHLHLLAAGRHWNAGLQAEWSRHGAAGMVFEVVALVPAECLRPEEEAALAAARSAGGIVFNLAPPRGNERRRHICTDSIDWSVVDWASCCDKQLARALGCSTTAVAARRPAETPSPFHSPGFLSRLHKKRLASLSDSERRERGRALVAARTPEVEVRRVEAVRRAMATRRRPSEASRG